MSIFFRKDGLQNNTRTQGIKQKQKMIIPVKIFHTITHKIKGLVFFLNLNENNFHIINDKYKLVGVKIEVGGKHYIIKEAEKMTTAAPVEWIEQRPIGVVVEELIENKA